MRSMTNEEMKKLIYPSKLQYVLLLLFFFLSLTNSSARIYESPYSQEIAGIPGADNEPPVTTITIGQPQYSIANDLYINSSTLISFSATDYGIAPSGVNYTEYKIDSDVWTRYTNPFNLGNYADGQHTITYRSVDNVLNVESGKTSTVVLDTTPPSGSIAINNHALYTRNANVTLSLHADDGNGSGVAKMCIGDTPSCTAWEDYAGTRDWTLNSGDGSKSVYAWYQDKLGNAGTTPSIASITLDTTPPALTVSTLSDGSWTNNQILNISGQATDNTGIQEININEAIAPMNPDWSFSHPVTLQDGPNTITVTAVDPAGNRVSDTRTINLDVNAPMITIETPADNMKTNQTPVDITGTVGEESAVTVSVNNTVPVPAQMDNKDFSLSVTPVYGINTIEATATDLAGNTSTAKRTVTFDDRNPSLAITEPSQDVKTNIADMTIRGETTDLTVVAVQITMDGNIYAPVLINGRFEQPVNFINEKTYQIYARATDEAGNETTVQRNVVYDTTSPMITLDPVTSPTNLNSQVLTGAMEAGSTVSVTCSTATVITVTYPTATTWAVTLSNMQEGSNTITVFAVDEAGNMSLPVSGVIVVSSGNAITNTGPAKLWIGLKNSDDQGTQFDLRTELYINGVLIFSGETLCITGVTRNPSYAKEVSTLFNPITNSTYASGDILSLRVLTRIGTTPDGQKCSGPGGSHNNAVGLRLYYDSPDRPSRFGTEISPEPMNDLFLHSSGTSYFLNAVSPTGAVKYKDSAAVNYNNGNPWKEIGTWTMVLQ